MSEAAKLSPKERFKAWYEGLSSKGRMMLLSGSGIAVIAVFGLFVAGEKDKKDLADETSSMQRNIVNADDILETTITERVEQQLRDSSEENAQLRAALEAQEESFAAAIADIREKDGDDIDALRQQLLEEARAAGVEGASSTTASSGRSYPTPPPIEGSRRASPLSLSSNEVVEMQLVGGIQSSLPPGAIDLPGERGPGATTSVYLAPGLMNAMLLTGVDALASAGGTANPEPIILRVQTPAVLPNYVRANLQGCFIVGNATGSLAKERVEVRVISLSCIDHNEQAVIDQPVKGFLVDMDGKKGLSGHVVTRAGALLGRTFLAGMLEGFGQGAQAAAGRQGVSPLGAVQTFNGGDVAQAGLGAGLARGSEKLSEYYLELAQQTVPVIEVGAAKKVVVVIQEGVNLEIRRDVNVIN
jgi:conjugal transfer pilus assembly protein TraB